MKPGRKLDALVAEKVMGIAPRRVRVKGTSKTVTIHSDNPYFSGGAYSQTDIWHAVARPYSTDIATAWQVVEKMLVRLLWVERKDDLWAVAFWRGDDNNGACEEVSSETAPHAICLAALKAVGA